MHEHDVVEDAVTRRPHHEPAMSGRVAGRRVAHPRRAEPGRMRGRVRV